MKHAFDVGQAAPISVSAQTNRRKIRLRAVRTGNDIEINDVEQLREMVDLLKDAAQELNWKGFERGHGKF